MPASGGRHREGAESQAIVKKTVGRAFEHQRRGEVLGVQNYRSPARTGYAGLLRFTTDLERKKEKVGDQS
jgi:hypothetical protein